VNGSARRYVFAGALTVVIVVVAGVIASLRDDGGGPERASTGTTGTQNSTGSSAGDPSTPDRSRPADH